MTDAQLAWEWLQVQVSNQRFAGDFRPDHASSLLALLTRVRLEEAEHIQFEVNWRLGNALLSEDPKIKEAHKWLKEHLATLRVPLEQAAGGSAAAGSQK